MPSGSKPVLDKEGQEIQIGDKVSTKMRGGKRVGEVEEITVTEEEAAQKGLKNPPKISLKDRHGHLVSHNPETLVHGDDPAVADSNAKK